MAPERMAQEKMAQEKMAQENKAQEKNGTLFSLGKNGTVQNVLKKTQAKNDTIRQYNQLKCVHTLFLYILQTFLMMLRTSIECCDPLHVKTPQLICDHHGDLGRGSSFVFVDSCKPFSAVSWEARHEILAPTG